MTRPPPLVVTMTQLSADSREKIAARLLTLEAARAVMSKAACEGLNAALLPVGSASLERTAAARALRDALRGFSFEWIEQIEKDGMGTWLLRLSWPFLLK